MCGLHGAYTVRGRASQIWFILFTCFVLLPTTVSLNCCCSKYPGFGFASCRFRLIFLLNSLKLLEQTAVCNNLRTAVILYSPQINPTSQTNKKKTTPPNKQKHPSTVTQKISCLYGKLDDESRASGHIFWLSCFLQMAWFHSILKKVLTEEMKPLFIN